MPTAYSILNHEEVLKDIEHRSHIIQDYKTIMEKRLRLEKQYSTSLREITYSPEFKRIPEATRASQMYFNSLINVFNRQADDAELYCSRLEQEVELLVSKYLVDFQTETKRQKLIVKTLLKDFDKFNQKRVKAKSKFFKKMEELKRLKQDHILGILSGLSFGEKNKQRIKITEIESRDYLQLKSDYDESTLSYNSFLEKYTREMKQSISKLSKLEKKKSSLLKQSFMILQISGSEFGANLVQENNVIMSRLNDLENSNPELIDNCQQSLESESKRLFKNNLEPFEYSTTLFKNIVYTKNVCNLIGYGQMEEYRRSLNNTLMKDEKEAGNQSPQKTPPQGYEKVIQYFKNIFDHNQNSEQDNLKSAQDLEKIMAESPELRKTFILCLQKFRRVGKFQIDYAKLPIIERIFTAFLNQCQAEKDTYNSKLLMVLSFTYHAKNGQTKKGLHHLILGHHIWKNRQWWECALLESVYEQLEVKSKKEEDTAISIWEIKGSGMKQVESENVLTFQNIIFNQITYYVHNMRLFFLPEPEITRFAKKYGTLFSLNNRLMADLESCLVAEPADSEGQSSISSPVKHH